jgi:hypothetical protein
MMMLQQHHDVLVLKTDNQLQVGIAQSPEYRFSNEDCLCYSFGAAAGSASKISCERMNELLKFL